MASFKATGDLSGIHDIGTDRTGWEKECQESLLITTKTRIGNFTTEAQRHREESSPLFLSIQFQPTQ
jgi:hypothetical protein